MSIFPLPVFEADADPRHREALTDEEIYERLEAPSSIVVKFGAMKLIGEYPYDGDAKPGCGSKMVARTHRGVELTEMLTTTCPNTGCNKAISRQEMLEYIDNSGGTDFPFHTNGKILRVATVDDLNAQSALNDKKPEYIRTCKAMIAELGLEMKLVEAEPILGGELLTFYYMSEDRVDFRELVRRLATEFKTRIEMRQIGARDEARLVADYERCGQHCCCKNFLKVLKPVSMRSAKVQKATLDPLKISGRCGRLMCCLRYEDQTYEDLRKKLPNRKKRVGTNFGPGIVMDSKILVQLVLVRLEHNNEEIAVPVEELMDPNECPQPDEHGVVRPLVSEDEADPMRGLGTEEVERRSDDRKRKRRGGGGKRSKTDQQDSYRDRAKREGDDGQQVGETPVERQTDDSASAETGSEEGKTSGRKRRRSRKRRSQGGGEARQRGPEPGEQSSESGADAESSPGRQRRRKKKDRKPSGPSDQAGGASGGSSDGPPKKKRRRRGGRKRGRGGGEGDGGGSSQGGEDSS